MRLASVILIVGFLVIVWFEPHQASPDTPKTTSGQEQIKQPKQETPQTPKNDPDEELADTLLASIRFVTLPAEYLPPSAETRHETVAPKANQDIHHEQPENNVAELTATPLQDLPSEPVSVMMPMTPPGMAKPAPPPAQLLPKPLLLELKPKPTLAALPSKEMISEPEPNTAKPLLKPLEKPMLTVAASPMPTPPVSMTLPSDNSNVKIDQPKMTLTASGQNRQHAMKQMDDADEKLELELFWPDQKTDRDKVANILRQCFGLTSGYLLKNGKLYDFRDGKVKAANRSYYSPYLRARSHIDTIEATHQASLKSELGEGTSVQLFSKIGDSYIIGGLLNATGTNQLHGQVSGSYIISQGQLYIDRIKVKGTLIAGRIALGDGRCI